MSKSTKPLLERIASYVRHEPGGHQTWTGPTKSHRPRIGAHHPARVLFCHEMGIEYPLPQLVRLKNVCGHHGCITPTHHELRPCYSARLGERLPMPTSLLPPHEEWNPELFQW